MNELDFRRHLKDMVHGHHHVEEHDWASRPNVAKANAAPRRTRPKPVRKRRASK